jgi:hypothetical protein
MMASKRRIEFTIFDLRFTRGWNFSGGRFQLVTFCDQLAFRCFQPVTICHRLADAAAAGIQSVTFCHRLEADFVAFKNGAVVFHVPKPAGFLETTLTDVTIKASMMASKRRMN